MNELMTFFTQEWQLASIFAGLLVVLLLIMWRERATGASRVDPQQATFLINKEQALVVDLRDNNAFAQGHIVGAKNIPSTRFKQDMAELKNYQSKPVILVCDMGRNSPSLGAWLRKQGFEKVFALSGGMQAWRNASLPVTQK